MSDYKTSRSVENSARIRSHAPDAVALIFAQNGDSLRWMVSSRLNRRIQGRIDLSTVLQEVFPEASKRAADYAATTELRGRLRLQTMIGPKPFEVQRLCFDTSTDVCGEGILDDGVLPVINARFQTVHWLGLRTSASKAANWSVLKSGRHFTTTTSGFIATGR
jgi:hypothetical protein